LLNKIIVLENGEIVEQGTHKELLAAQKQYYELFQKQMSEESY
jgi:ABC-type multidrug transport system fused ATPase/permease subunit